ncbi:hypothetical protein ES703_116042 [subsurface metagenome]
MRLKLITAPPMAMSNTRAEMKNWVMAEDVSIRTAFSDWFRMSSYSAIRLSITLLRSCKPMMVLSTWSRVCASLRQYGIIFSRREWRTDTALRYSSMVFLYWAWALLCISPKMFAIQLSPFEGSFASVSTALTQSGDGTGTSVLSR